MTWDVVYTVVALTVFVVGWGIAYARGYSAGHDDGFSEACESKVCGSRRGCLLTVSQTPEHMNYKFFLSLSSPLCYQTRF